MQSIPRTGRHALVQSSHNPLERPYIQVALDVDFSSKKSEEILFFSMVNYKPFQTKDLQRPPFTFFYITHAATFPSNFKAENPRHIDASGFSRGR